jgi:hypothetical protein
MGKGDRRRACLISRERYETNFEEAFECGGPPMNIMSEGDRVELGLAPFWTGPGYRGEYQCPHGVGHADHIHGCDGCCGRSDFPLWRRK